MVCVRLAGEGTLALAVFLGATDWAPLLAFTFAGFAGSFFAARQGLVTPESFTFIESAIILAIVVLGGMGSQLGVILAAWLKSREAVRASRVRMGLAGYAHLCAMLRQQPMSIPELLQRAQIGVLKAFGYGTGAVLAHYLKLAAGAVLAGTCAVCIVQGTGPCAAIGTVEDGTASHTCTGSPSSCTR